MKSMRSLPARHALEQLFQTRPVLPLQGRQAFNQALLRATSPSHQTASFRTRAGRVSQPSLTTRTTTRTIHSQRLPNNPLRSPNRPSPSSSPSRSTNPFLQSFRRRGGRRSNSSSSSGSASGPQEKLSLSQRLKKLSREYGWSALGVYLLLTALDFPFCFLAVRLLGTDRIGHWEHVVVSYVKGLINWPATTTAAVAEDVDSAVGTAEKPGNADVVASKRILDEQSHEQYVKENADTVSDHGYKEAEKANSGANASIWTQLALAYAIHKSFIFVRVPLTAAVTPKVVKTLRSWGWNIGKVPKSSSAGASAGASSNTSSSVAATQAGKTGVNTRGSKVRPED
ncbi:hypothetical protein A1O3_09688 [Capronia epimyces CBS 606.96]|uniref:DUF1279 domain-containing protein n=1 Tax=Capronia epimyces CBS 606.96 TaxID=1182542 RepID=W9XAG0_9EURO|nr:uncharacterized protein A1O3_09688 [Capronia epimyces CBS 606.96]EXJ77462.1 hypothetical protein A1O3_09688 [Capronia epimyces CBS 606.96]